jgi:hypothetical protein
VTLTQVNTDGEVMRLYLSKLAMTLDGMRPNWRQDTVIQLDNAKYHKSEIVQKHIQMLEMPVIYGGPYGYSCMSTELFFAYFKRGQINPTF